MDLVSGSSSIGFNPRTPCGVRPALRSAGIAIFAFQSTHSLRSATSDKKEVRDHEGVSIHALLAECDSGRKNSIYLSVVSIHALLAECDWHRGALREFEIEFQSTHSLRSATLSEFPLRVVLRSFNPRTPCGVRRVDVETMYFLK